MIGYHFTSDKLRDGRPVPKIGEILRYDGWIAPCVCGLHASKHPFDALQYASGPMLHKVKLTGDLMPYGNPIEKYVGRERVIIATIDATDVLRHSARLCALDVIHLWDAPPVVVEYLETGNEDLRDAAWDAAGTTGAVWAAVWYTATRTTDVATRATRAAGAARYAARSAAEHVAAMAAIRSVTGGYASGYATMGAVRSATGAALGAPAAAAWATSGNDYRSARAAWAAAEKNQRKRFARMVNNAFRGAM